MKSITNIFISHLVLLILFGGAAFALAQTEEVDSEEETSTQSAEETVTEKEVTETQSPADQRRENNGEEVGTRENIQANRQENTENRQLERQENQEMREEVQVERQETRRANLNDQSRQRITNLAALMSNRIEAALVRMLNISTRLDSRIDKMAAEGLEVTKAESSLASANLSLEAVRESISTIDSQVAAVVGAEDVRVAWQNLKTIFTDSRDQLKTAQMELRNTVSALKSAPAQSDTEAIPEESEEVADEQN